MSTPSQDFPHEVTRALDLLIEGELPGDEAQGLQKRMKQDPALFSLYLEKVRMDSLLRDHAWRGVKPTTTAPTRPGTTPSRRWPLLAALACVVLLMAAYFATPYLRQQRAGSKPERVHTTVQFSAGSDFSSGSPVSADGGLEFGEEVTLKDGAVSIRLPSGVEAVLKSPSQFALTGENRLKLDQGVGWFRVPPAAKGFTVELPELDVVDLGTVFTVKVEGNLHEVQVEQGRVETRARNGGHERKLVTAGQKLVYRSGSDSSQVTPGKLLFDPSSLANEAEIVFQESLAKLPDQPFTQRTPLKGTWVVQTGNPNIRGGRFAADSDFTHLMGRFTRPIEPSENAVVLVSFKSVSPLSLFHSKGFAGISLFDGDGELFFFGDKGSDSYSWELLTFGKQYRGPNEQRKAYDLSIQGSEETFTLRYRQRTGEFEVFRGRGAQGMPLVRGKTDPALRLDGVRIANGKGGDFSLEDLEVSVVRDGRR